MSIESARLVIGSAKRDGVGGRATPPPVCIRIYAVEPLGAGSVYYDPPNIISTAVECVGQLVAYQNPSDPNNVRLFIAADEQTWVPVDLASFFIDSRTGKPWDPNAGFYNPLAA